MIVNFTKRSYSLKEIPNFLVKYVQVSNIRLECAMNEIEITSESIFTPIEPEEPNLNMAKQLCMKKQSYHLLNLNRKTTKEFRV